MCFFFPKQLFHGTPVTVENFLNWKAKFDAELLEIKKKRMKEEEQAGKNKISGRQLFETDHNLDTSDIQFLEDAANNVEVGSIDIIIIVIMKLNF